MKKFLFVLSMLVFSACGSASNNVEGNLVDLEKEIHDYFARMVRFDEELLWMNVVGTEKAENGYGVEVVVFREDDSVFREEYLALETNRGLAFEQINSTELQWEQKTVVDEFEEKEMRVFVTKRLVASDFFTFDGLVVPGYLGRYDLWIEKAEEELLVDSSFDPFSTNIPFDVWKFSDDGRFLEYFEQDFGRLYNLYDLEEEKLIDVIVPGVVGESFWLEGELYICTRSGDLRPVAVKTIVEEWKEVGDFEFLYPSELNGLKEEDLWEELGSEVNGEKLECSVESGEFKYELV